MIGWIKDETGSFPMALMPIAAVAAIGTICILTMGRNQPRTAPVTALRGEGVSAQGDESRLACVKAAAWSVPLPLLEFKGSASGKPENKPMGT